MAISDDIFSKVSILQYYYITILKYIMYTSCGYGTLCLSILHNQVEKYE